MRYLNSTVESYGVVERDAIQYTYCRDYDHVSRYRGLRQVIHQGQSPDRYVALESPNAFESHTNVTYYTVPANRENRLDIIAQELLGSPDYKWVIAYFNGITDGFSVREGMTLQVPKSVSSLFESGEILQPIAATKMNLGTEN